MPPKIIKLGKREDIASAIQQVKKLREREVVFQLEKGSLLLATSDNLKLLKRTGESLGKTVKIETDDEIGRILAKKAGVLYGDEEVKMPKPAGVRVARSDVKPRFSDILGSRRILNKAVGSTVGPVAAISSVAKLSRINSEPSRLSRSFYKLFILGLVILIVAVFGLAVFLPKATVTVFARSEQVSRDLELTVDKNTTQVNTDNLQIPGVTVDREVSQTKNFPATGVKFTGVKASGTVTIYNFTKNTLTLKAATTTLSVSGKNYFFTKNIAGIKPNGVANDGIQIIADQAGNTYNLPANTKFQISNPALGNQNVYAMNPGAIGGGAGTSATVVSQKDLDKAVQSLSDAALNQAQSDLTQETGVTTRLVPSGVTEEILSKTADKNANDAADSFNMTVIAKITGLSFKESDVINTVVAKINQVMSSDKYLDETAKKNYTAIFKSIDIPNAHGVLAVHFETMAGYKVDTTSLAKILVGKNESEIKEILLSKPEIDNVTVFFWPKWFVNKAPRFSGRIQINTVLSQNQ